MKHENHLDRLRDLPQFRHLTRDQLVEVGRLAETVELDAGAEVIMRVDDVVLAAAPTRLLIIDRRARDRFTELTRASTHAAIDR
jgi:hypothetical protein